MAPVFHLLLLIFFSYSPSKFLSAPSIEKLFLPGHGPESFAFDALGGGPYTSIADGRVVKYGGPTLGFLEFATTAPNRSKEFCDGTNRTDLAHTCGRPLGLRLHYATGQLYIQDAAFGLLVVGPGGGLAKQLVTSAEGVPFRLPDAVDVDQRTGTVYLADASAVYSLHQIQELVSTRDATGRVMKYDPKTKQITVLLRGLSGASGVAISEDGSFLLATESVGSRIQKYWLIGPNANTSEILLNVRGIPNKIIRNAFGDFWIALTVQSQAGTSPVTSLQGLRINGNGTILETLTFSPQFGSSLSTEVHEYNGKLYLGSLYGGYVGVYSH